MKSILALLACLALSCVHSISAPPNIIFILADDMGYSDLGCYGGDIETPNLDSLARNGLRFTQFYNTARCWPTRGALMTGYYAQQIRRDALPEVSGGSGGVRPEWARLLPDFLKPAGYRSYHSGKWHIDGNVIDAGFDRSFHTKNDGNFFTVKGNFLDDKPITPAADESSYYVTTATADHAIDCLKDHAANHRDKPFFHYIPFIAPHFPLHALPQDIAKYRDKYLDGWEAMREARFHRGKEMGIINTTLSALEREVGPPYAFPDAMKKLGPAEVNRPLPWSELTEAQRRFQATKMAIHAAMVDRMDQEIGRILTQLKEMGAYDNTLIFFASDNGASAEMMVRHGGHDPQAVPGSAATYLCLGPGFSSACNTPFRRHKTWVHEGGISTPLIAHWPKGITAKNELRHTPAHVIDIVPTVLELAGAEKPAAWNGVPIPPAPGKSLVPALAKDERISRDSLWWLHEGHRAIRIGDWKLTAAKGDSWELYDLRTDRAEQHNLAAGMPEKVKELEQAWQRQTASFTDLVKKTASKAKPEGSQSRAKGQAKARPALNAKPMGARTRVAIDGTRWLINGAPVHAGTPAEGLLMNARMVNAIFEDTGAAGRERLGAFDPEANVRRFIARVPEYVGQGISAFTLSLQGGHPGYEGAVNSAFNANGSLRAPYLDRVARVIKACDRHGAVVILSCFYQRQHSHPRALAGQAALRAAVRNVAGWIREQQFGNVVLEVANEYAHGGFARWPDGGWLRSAEGQAALIREAKAAAPELLVSTSGMGDGRISDEIGATADFILIHFNTTALADYGARLKEGHRFGKPVVCNEDDKIGTAGAEAARLCVQHNAAWGFMHSRKNQYAPFEFDGPADDAAVYGALRELTLK